jgi:hypothetical protein
MDTDAVRAQAEAHARAVVEGDLRAAARDLAPEARAKAGDVMQQLPTPLESAEVTSVDVTGASGEVRIEYRGGRRAATVQTRWEERGTRPTITDLEVLS